VRGGSRREGEARCARAVAAVYVDEAQAAALRRRVRAARERGVVMRAEAVSKTRLLSGIVLQVGVAQQTVWRRGGSACAGVLQAA